MKAAETQASVEHSDTKFLDVLWRRHSSKLQPTIDFFTQIANRDAIQCLIPNKLYTQTLKKSNSEKSLTKTHNAIKVHYLLKDIDDNPLIGSYQMQEPSLLHLNDMIPGLSHGLLGMKEGEVREIFIHPDFVYGTSSTFGNGQAIKAVVELIELGEANHESAVPSLKPVDVLNDAPDISSCSEYIDLQKKHAYACGLRSWQYYKKAVPLITLESVLNEISHTRKTLLSDTDSHLLLKLEWLLLQE